MSSHLDLEVQEGAIVARMSAVEEMAGMDILCSDKTGTLTLNQLSVDKATVLVTVPDMPYASLPTCCRANFAFCRLTILQTSYHGMEHS